MCPDLISNISVDATNQDSEKIFLTFDLDWCSDEVFETTLSILEKRDVCATFFVTHSTPLLARLRENPKFELGIHPNFNFLMEGDGRYGKTYKSIIEHFLSIVPEAVSVRSHSLSQSSRLLKTFSDLGLTHDCNLYLPPPLLPKAFLHWDDKLIRVPHFFEDDIECMTGWMHLNAIRNMDDLNCIKVFDMHPIHVFLNSESIHRYIDASSLLQNHIELSRKVNTSHFGTRDLLLELLGRCS